MTDELKPEPMTPELIAAYAFVDSVVDKATIPPERGGYLWAGWVLRQAYLAGVRAERESPPPPAVSGEYEDIFTAEWVQAAVLAERERLTVKLEDVMVGCGISKGDRDYILERLAAIQGQTHG